jgi:hypothetical protein
MLELLTPEASGGAVVGGNMMKRGETIEVPPPKVLREVVPGVSLEQMAAAGATVAAGATALDQLPSIILWRRPLILTQGAVA